MKREKIIIWSTDVSNLHDGNASGIGVQLYFWAQTFVRHGWEVITFTLHKSFKKDGISYKQTRSWGKLEIIHDWFHAFWLLLIVHPSIIMLRGASRTAYPLAVLSSVFRTKFVFFGASDTNFEENEHVSGGNHNTLFYRRAVNKMSYVVTQNQYQHDTLKKNYGKNSLVLYNLWGQFPNSTSAVLKKTDIVWVANFAILKRAEWMINAAKAMPEYDFTLIGGKYRGQEDYYDDIEQEAKEVSNLHFIGKKSFAESNMIVSKSRVLCCTSTFEGFPNTFLQAWSNDIPVVSTVNPSEVITTFGLGAVVRGEEEFQQCLRKLLQVKTYYEEVSANIHDYFRANHEADSVYEKFISWLVGK